MFNRAATAKGKEPVKAAHHNDAASRSHDEDRSAPGSTIPSPEASDDENTPSKPTKIRQIGGHVIPLRYVFFIYVVALRMLKKSSSALGGLVGPALAVRCGFWDKEESNG